MTGSNDLDRELSAYLDGGPSRAPERAVDAAIAHARAHPRRRDPLLFLRPDVMGRRVSTFRPQLVWAVVVLGLVLAGVTAVAVGSRLNQAPVVVPPVVSPSPTISTPSPAPSPSTFTIPVGDEDGFSRTLTLTDASGTVQSIENGPVADVGPETGIVAANDPAGPTRVFLTWPYKPCDEELVLAIDATGTVIRLERHGCVIGDTIGGNPHRVTLTFAGPVDASTLQAELVEVP
jgi:hypothetical protein